MPESYRNMIIFGAMPPLEPGAKVTIIKPPTPTTWDYGPSLKSVIGCDGRRDRGHGRTRR